ncbi:MAG TPA: M48 family metalloprotease [Woeseiaceae bacterium]|nr:M48 family metalloprotease [Woeseiaceae bacterium]
MSTRVMSLFGIRRRNAWLTLFGAAALTVSAGLPGAEVNLPDIGSPADAVLSKSDEARIGRQIMHSIRASGKLVEDPIVTEYINEIGHRLSAQVNEGDHEFTFFVVEDPQINAFALPGGYVGVHTGLIEATRNEDELAGVLGHEIAHVTQRHIARAVHASQRQSILSMAIMLGAILAGAAGAGGDAMQGAIAVAQGTAAQQQINFTRSNEYEADRIGIAALADAGFDPNGMASFFEVISDTTTPAEARVPEFLRTHPVSSARIAEARNRARGYPRVKTEHSTGYGIARARLMVAEQETAEEAVALFEQKSYERQTDSERYGRAVAYMRAGRYKEANRIFEELANKDQEVIPYHIGLAESQLALERIDEARATFVRARELFPRNVPLTVHYAEALLRLDNAKLAHTILLDLLNNVPPTPEQVRLIARAAIDAGDVAEAYYYMAEYSFMTGDLMQGVNFLKQALQVPDLNEIQRSRFEARLNFIREFMSEEQLRQLQQSRSVG